MKTGKQRGISNKTWEDKLQVEGARGQNGRMHADNTAQRRVLLVEPQERVTQEGRHSGGFNSLGRDWRVLKGRGERQMLPLLFPTLSSKQLNVSAPLFSNLLKELSITIHASEDQWDKKWKDVRCGAWNRPALSVQESQEYMWSVPMGLSLKWCWPSGCT